MQPVSFSCFFRVILRLSVLSVPLTVKNTITTPQRYNTVDLSYAPTAQSPCGVNAGQRDGAPSNPGADALTRSTTRRTAPRISTAARSEAAAPKPRTLTTARGV